MDHQIKPRAAILNTPYDQHGAPDYAELQARGVTPSQIIDFSVNSNPFGTHPKIQNAVQNVSLERYPDRDCLALRHALSSHLSQASTQPITTAHLVVTNGTAELIALLTNAYLTEQDSALICAPTFGEYARAVKLRGATAQYYWATAQTNYAFEIDAIQANLSAAQHKLCFICNPNNPTGNKLPIADLLGLAAQFPQTLFVIDEAYFNFMRNAERFTQVVTRNIIAMCSMTKEYAIAGLRLGYGVAHPEIVDAVSRTRPPWSVNSMAQAAGIAAIDSHAAVVAQLAQLQQLKQTLAAALEAQGWTVLPSATNYFLVQVGNAKAARNFLMQRKLQVRDCTSFGLPAYIRIAARLAHENEQLIAALAAYKKTEHQCDSILP